MKLSIAPLIGALLLAACAGEDSGTGKDPLQDAGAGGATSGAGGGPSTGGVRGTACVAQEVQECTPLSGCSGTRTCLLNQSGYGPCVCTPPPEAGTDGASDADAAPPDAQVDGAPETGPGPDAEPEAGSDAGPEAGSGGSSSTEAGSGGAPSAGGASSGDAAADGASSGDAETGG